MILAPRFALRELRSGVKGFRIFLACLALGVGALAAAGSTAEALRESLAGEARAILGGDLVVQVQGRRFSAKELALATSAGRVGRELRATAMAEGPKGRELVEARGVEDHYPLVGSLGLEGAQSLGAAIGGGRGGVVASRELEDQLGLTPGREVRLGDARFPVRAILDNEPDRLGRGFALAPALILGRGALEASGVIGPDALFGETIRILLPEGSDPAAAAARLRRGLGADVEVRTRIEAAAGLGRLLAQLEFFLSFLGLASLLAGGLGVGSAVSAYLRGRTRSIAVLKALGASGGFIRSLFLLQILTLGAIGTLIGLGLGALTPPLLGWAFHRLIDTPSLYRLHLAALGRSAVFGFLALLVFSLLPIARARATQPVRLLRQELATRTPIGVEVVLIGLCLAGLGALVLDLAPEKGLAIGLGAGLLAAFVGLAVLGEGARRLAGALRGRAKGALALGLANLASPRSAARIATPAAGFGVALLTALLLIQSSLLREVSEAAPRSAPSAVFTQIPSREGAGFDALAAAVIGPLTPDRYRRFPFFTGRVVAIGGRPIDARALAPAGRWAFDRDVGMSALDLLPDDGAPPGGFWPSGYLGPPKVVIDRGLAAAADIRPGETLDIQVLGRDLLAEVAGARTVAWTGFGANFPYVLDPKALEGAQLRQVVLVRLPPDLQARLAAAVARRFPEALVIDVRAQLELAERLFSEVGWAVRGAAGVAGLAGALVLLAALAASGRGRAREAAVLKVLGAERAMIVLAYFTEYGLVGLIAALAGLLLGAGCALPVTRLLLKAPFRPDLRELAVVVLGFVVFAAALGALAGWRALGERPAAALRED